MGHIADTGPEKRAEGAYAMKEKICIFAGTTEGRVLARELCEKYELTVCVATDYGREMLEGIHGIRVRVGRMDGKEMEAFLRDGGFSRVLDATHPYALEASRNIRLACERAGTPLLRVVRESGAASGAVYVTSAGEAARYLAGREGNILLTTGAKELPDFAALDSSRLWARVLPMESSLRACEAAGVPVSHIIAMQGPFSRELNEALLRQTGARWLVTKSSGAAGGFSEKLEAARALNVTPVVIGPPTENPGGVSLNEALELLLPREKSVTLIGVGPGGPELLTGEAKRALEEAGAVIGARTVLDAVQTAKPRFAAFRPEEVRAVLEAHSFRNPAVVLRGDVGFYSGAGKIRDALTGWRVTLLPGIASPVYFAAKLGIPWDRVKLLSLHGREGGLVRAVDENERVMVLTGGANSVAAVLHKLCEYGFGDLSVTVGERLSYPDERLTRGTARELAGREFDGLSILLVENPNARRALRRGIPDGEFIRGGVPMTCAQVRAVCLAELAPESGSVVWDVGSGTGSVTVECALSAPEGHVYAVDVSPLACDLTRQNARKFRADNVTVVEGPAPEALERLPAPTHVFIGGSSGKIREIVAAAFGKNPAARIVATAVTLETLSELTACMRDPRFKLRNSGAVTVSAARSREAGRFHLMAAQNPVTVFTMQGEAEDE